MVVSLLAFMLLGWDVCDVISLESNSLVGRLSNSMQISSSKVLGIQLCLKCAKSFGPSQWSLMLSARTLSSIIVALTFFFLLSFNENDAIVHFGGCF